LGPRANLLLSLLRVVLLAVLGLGVLKLAQRAFEVVKRPSGPPSPSGVATAGTLLLVLLGGMAVPVTAQAQVPPPEMLEQLRERLLEKPQCAPTCASSPRMHIDAKGNALQLRLEILTGAETAVPLPGNAQHWLPEQVMVDDRMASGMRRDGEGTLWLALPEGAHRVLMSGALPGGDTVQIALPLRPHRIEATLDGWTLDGLHEDGLADESLQLTRKKAEENAISTLQPGNLPAFVRVERTLFLGMHWTVETTVRRLTPTGSAVVLEVPLLAGESVPSRAVRVQNGRALVNMPAAVTEVSWASILDARSPIELVAPRDLPWVEIWRLDASPVWHTVLSGIPMIPQQEAAAVRVPEWHPWPGEKVTIEVVRPEGVQGQTLTIDQSRVVLSPGARVSNGVLTVNMRSSRGGLHPFTLPEGAKLQSVTVNGNTQPIRQEGRTVAIPLLPGSQSVELNWSQPGGLETSWTTPALGLGTQTVNADLQVEVPRDRWILFATGPRMGPAVLFWSFLLVLLIVAAALGQVRWTPLKTWHWVLLALGLSQVPIPAIAFVFGWLLLLGWRQQKPELHPALFDLRQLALVGVTLAALIILAVSVYEGLLGRPEMQIEGNGSGDYSLRWFQDRTGTEFPQAWVLSVPMLVYRFAMLAWALWMAVAMLRWLKWGWQAFSTGGLWRNPVPKQEPTPPVKPAV